MSDTQIVKPAEESKREHSFIEADYISKPELAQMLRVDKRTLERWCCLRIGPPKTVIGKTVLFRRGAVIQWLHDREERRTRDGKRRRA